MISELFVSFLQVMGLYFILYFAEQKASLGSSFVMLCLSFMYSTYSALAFLLSL